ncbi:MAG: DUF2867 domain-containing protein [Actinomycetales bacterium]|nr:DUF2867 domain-containing protein [Actinomycetales bacterium]
MREPVARDLGRIPPRPGADQVAPLALVTGATGYVGGRLVPELLANGYRVRVLVRHPDRVRDHPWAADVEVVAGDALDADAVGRACADVDVLFYLLHALVLGHGFGRVEDEMAQIAADAASTAGVRRIVYLGGLLPGGGRGDARLSEHLSSRMRTGEILRSSGVPTIELRAGVILGSGSTSFEMLRYLTEHLPAMITPKWVRTRIQPISVRDVLRYLVGAAALPPAVNRAFDIGGPDVLTYEQMMRRYARINGLGRRVIVPVPLLTPRLSSLWVGLVTPVPSAIAKPLVRSLRNEVVCQEQDIRTLIPDPPGGLLGFDDAVELAVRRVRDADVRTRWSSASLPWAPSDPLPTDPTWAGGSLYEDVRTIEVPAPAAEVWRVVEGIGGVHGYFSMDWAWRARGLLDWAVGGVGLSRGRRDPDHLRIGETLDFWRVEELIPERQLRLRAEMKNPGLAWLEFTLEPLDGGHTRLVQRAVFYPRGLGGHAYWWAVAPFHGIVFPGMARNIGERAAAAAPVAVGG